MKCTVRNVIAITQGSREDILIRMTDPDTGERLDLSQFESGEVKFCTSAGTVITKAIDPWPVADPKLGVIEFQLSSDDTAQFDEQMTDFEAEFVYTGTTDKKVLIFENALEVTERVC